MKSKVPHQFHPMIFLAINHIRACLLGFGELMRAPLASIMTIAVIGVAMALPAGFYLLLQNFQSISKSWQDSPSISLYLKKNITDKEAQQIINDLKNKPSIKTVTYISAEQGLEEFKKATQLGDVISALNNNPLPPVLIVTPRIHGQSPNNTQQLLMDLKAMPMVDVAEFDMTWVKRLYYFIAIGKRIVDALALLFCISVILIVGNTIRLTTQNHRQEITILKLVGATNAFIRRPLLYRGLIYGLLGGGVAWLLVSTMLWWLSHPVALLAQTYGNDFRIHGLNPVTGMSILTITGILGFLGSWAAIRRHLTAPENL